MADVFPGCSGLQGKHYSDRAKLPHLLWSPLRVTQSLSLYRIGQSIRRPPDSRGRNIDPTSQWESGKVTLKKSVWDGRHCCSHLWKMWSAASYHLHCPAWHSGPFMVPTLECKLCGGTAFVSLTTYPLPSTVHGPWHALPFIWAANE